MIKNLLIIDDTKKVVIPEKLNDYQKIINFDEKTLIMTLEKDSERIFGGSCIKISFSDHKDDYLFVSSTLTKEELKKFILVVLAKENI